MRNTPVFHFCISLLATLCMTSSVFGEGLRDRSIGRKMDSFSLTQPLTESRWSLADDGKEADAVVLYFLSTECPVTNRYLPSLNRLAKSDFGKHKVLVVAINSNGHDSTQEIKKHAEEYELEFVVLHDQDGSLARQLGVKRTAEAILLDQKRKIRYRGVVDDRFERGVTKPKATEAYLDKALKSVLNRRHVETALTPVEACPLNLPGQSKPSEEKRVTTYSEHAAAIIQRRCQSCHRPDGIGPFELVNYDDAHTWSESIREVLTNDLMPPWHADAPHGHFVNDRSLTDLEYKTLLDWIDDGAVEGDPAKAPAPRAYLSYWNIENPDLVLEMEKAINVPAETPPLGVPYKYVWAGKPFEKERWVTAAEVRPGAPAVVHHASVYIVPEGTEIKLKNDDRPAGLGELFSPISNLQHLVSFVPGDSDFVFRKGLGVRIPKGARLIFEMHYTPTGKKEKDQTQLGLKFAKERPKHEVFSGALINYMFSIPPGAEAHQVQARTRKFRRDTVLLSMNPHMHYRGKSFKYNLVGPAGERSVLLDVPNYRFDWQSTYRLKEPVLIPKGAYIEGVATFDNSKDNPFNPDPTKRVEWGEQSWEEMMLGSYEFHRAKK